MLFKGLPVREAPSVGGTPPLKDILNRAETPELSPQAQEHIALVSSIATSAMQDLDAIRDDIERLRAEIVLRTRLLGDATVEFDRLVRTTTRGYGLIRQSLDMVREKFASALPPAPPPPPPPAESEPDESH